MKFANIIKGTAAEREIEVPGYTNPDGTPFKVILRPLTGLEHEGAFAAAHARALEKGVTDPKIGDPIYDLALMAFVIAVGCWDPDSPPTARTYSFDSGLQILKEMHPETIVYLHEHHETWQSECSPSTTKVDGENLMEKVREVAGLDGATTFMRFSPATRLNFTISTARLLLTSLARNSISGSNSEQELPKFENNTTQGSSP